jgi:hypothetical protein
VRLRNGALVLAGTSPQPRADAAPGRRRLFGALAGWHSYVATCWFLLQRVVPDRPTTTGAPAEGVADVAGGESGWLGAVVRSTHGMLPSDLLRVVQTAACARLGSATENAGLTPATSAPGLDSCPSHLHQDWGLDVLAAARALRAASLRDTTAVGRDPRLALALALTVPCRAGPVPCPLPSPSPQPSKVPSGSCRAFAPAAHRAARLLSHRRGLAENGPAGFHGRTEARAELRSCTVAALDQLDVYRAVGIKPPSGVLVCVPPPHAARPPQHSVLSAAPHHALQSEHYA